MKSIFILSFALIQSTHGHNMFVLWLHIVAYLFVNHTFRRKYTSAVYTWTLTLPTKSAVETRTGTRRADWIIYRTEHVGNGAFSRQDSTTGRAWPRTANSTPSYPMNCGCNRLSKQFSIMVRSSKNRSTPFCRFPISIYRFTEFSTLIKIQLK